MNFLYREWTYKNRASMIPLCKTWWPEGARGGGRKMCFKEKKSKWLKCIAFCNGSWACPIYFNSSWSALGGPIGYEFYLFCKIRGFTRHLCALEIMCDSLCFWPKG